MLENQDRRDRSRDPEQREDKQKHPIHTRNMRAGKAHVIEIRSVNIAEGEMRENELTPFQSDIKAAFKRAVVQAGGCVKVAAAVGHSESVISRYGNPDDPSFPPVHILHAVDKLAAEPICLQVMAADWGFDLVPTAGAEATPQHVMTAVAEFAEASGELESVTLRAASDGRISTNERTAIRAKSAEVSSKQRLLAELTV